MARAYIKGWKKLRQQAIEAAEGKCALCRKDMEEERWEVDHIRAIVDGGSPDDPSNLHAICSACHKPRTIAQIKRTAKIKRIVDKVAGKERKWKKKLQTKPMSKSYKPFNSKNRLRNPEDRGKMR